MADVFFVLGEIRAFLSKKQEGRVQMASRMQFILCRQQFGAGIIQCVVKPLALAMGSVKNDYTMRGEKNKILCL